MMKKLKKIGIVLGIFMAVVVALLLFSTLLSRPLSEDKLKEIGVIESDSLFVDVGGIRTRYVEKGSGEETIIFIHGFSSSLYSWRDCLDPISKQYRAIALDLKGFGFSDKPESDYTTGEYVDFVIAFMDALGLEKATLCGNSMGGGIAWRTALAHPDRIEKLILVDAAGYPSTRSGLPLIMMLGRLPGSEKLFSLLTTRGRIRSSLVSATYKDEVVDERRVDAYYYPMRTEGAAYAVLARMRSPRSETEKWQEKIRELRLPTLIVWGVEDTWIPVEDAEKFNKDIAGSRLLIIPECGHLPQEEEPEKFAISVLDFMAGNNGEILMAGPRIDSAAPEASVGASA